MRQLTISQKKLLNKAMVENPEIQTVEDLPSDIWERLEEINRYLSDAYYTREFKS